MENDERLLLYEHSSLLQRDRIVLQSGDPRELAYEPRFTEIYTEGAVLDFVKTMHVVRVEMRPSKQPTHRLVLERIQKVRRRRSARASSQKPARGTK